MVLMPRESHEIPIIGDMEVSEVMGVSPVFIHILDWDSSL